MPGQYIIKPIEAKLNDSCNFNKEMKPFCLFTFGAKQFSTNPANFKGDVPTWDSPITILSDADNSFNLRLSIKEKDESKDALGNCQINLKEIESQGRFRQWYPLQCNNKDVGEILLDSIFEEDLSDKNRGEQSDKKKDQLYDKNFKDLFDKDGGDYSDKNKGERFDKDKGQLSNKNWSDPSDRNRDEFSDKNKEERFDQVRGDISDKNRSNLFERDRGEYSDKNKGEGFDKDKGQLSDKNWSDLSSRNRGEYSDKDREERFDQGRGDISDKNRSYKKLGNIDCTREPISKVNIPQKPRVNEAKDWNQSKEGNFVVEGMMNEKLGQPFKMSDKQREMYNNFVPQGMNEDMEQLQWARRGEVGEEYSGRPFGGLGEKIGANRDPEGQNRLGHKMNFGLFENQNQAQNAGSGWNFNKNDENLAGASQDQAKSKELGKDKKYWDSKIQGLSTAEDEERGRRLGKQDFSAEDRSLWTKDDNYKDLIVRKDDAHKSEVSAGMQSNPLGGNINENQGGQHISHRLNPGQFDI